MNPGVEDLPRLGCERMLFFVAEEDYLTVAAKNYYEKLKRSRWKGTAELVENEKEDHYFHMLLGKTIFVKRLLTSSRRNMSV
ncbi:hypothetical protein Peur_008620 [Populus x canadensis]